MCDQCEQLQVQLAGCSVVALGGSPQVQKGDYGWSPAYQDVVDLRERYDEDCFEAYKEGHIIGGRVARSDVARRMGVERIR